ncbi:dTDP-4-dehydrorhamnose 3,5-epimerase [Cupriavidus necator]|uniref:dTDP-4-dehydrorhamnose 3,5-epimerase n=1 Tax=Cupriavidus necator (strain ATCC 17699 / DSM 428 / KCTC 22496 / NCIMB 10442 / H16 / Stanier 337) TaxID=381666 RepID=Q0K7N9_CUPNH|nr:dTDP-4-dehydrorhamnose 3,5-epimerase [Cupriavidus necator]QCC01751.1 dTDP-4-dehydrorhamnose 3,5-epimerase [Cupriavidus necator H16]QQB75419.1 dTDP-4-dehydrorhamnose 3,5-epimerase [Cupriavidus necator]WKA40150.1 dTDP-4-dehydrorhamnose 3,5-epimerase [Cupriavidus necator]CAJ93982.1 dTDP-4-dehydrorhamnose 3,5-epimerase [Cupriavidus necator H16]
MKITITPTALPEVLVIEPQVFSDQRGFFMETFNAQAFEQATGIRRTFVQDNHSGSVRNVLRGLHYQIQHPQGKLIRVIAGEVFDVAVDVRLGSPTYGKWVGVTVSAADKKQLWIPEGFAHGFLVLSEHAEVLYKTTDYWYPEHERTLLWNDPAVGVRWPLNGAPLLTAKDAAGKLLTEADVSC